MTRRVGVCDISVFHWVSCMLRLATSDSISFQWLAPKTLETTTASHALLLQTALMPFHPQHPPRNVLQDPLALALHLKIATSSKLIMLT